MNLDASAFVAEPELIQALKSHSRPVECKEDHVLFCQGEEASGLYILHAGSAHVTMWDAEGVMVAEFTAAPGSLLGLPGVVSNSAYSLSAAAAAGAEVSLVPRDEFSHLMLSEPEAAMMILRVLANEVRTARVAAYKG